MRLFLSAPFWSLLRDTAGHGKHRLGWIAVQQPLVLVLGL